MKPVASPLLLATIALVFLVSCRALRVPEFQYVENLRVEKLGANNSTLSANLRYRNPNRSRLKLKQAEGEAWLDNNYLGHFSVDSTVIIPPDGEFNLPIKLRLSMDQVLQNSLLLLSNEEVPLRIEGKAKLGKAGVFVNYPFRYEGKQNLRKLMR